MQTCLSFDVFNVRMSMRHIHLGICRSFPLLQLYTSKTTVVTRTLLRHIGTRARERERKKISLNPLQVRKKRERKTREEIWMKREGERGSNWSCLLLPHIFSSVLYWQLSIWFRSYNLPVHILFLMPSTLWVQKEKQGWEEEEVIVHISPRKYSPSGHQQQLVTLLIHSFSHIY